MYPNRYVCTVLEEMREQLKMLDVHSLERFKSIHSMMIEEAQSMVNRMEASLEDGSDVKKMLDKRSELSKEVKALKKKVKELKVEAEEEVEPDRSERIGSSVLDLLDDIDD